MNFAEVYSQAGVIWDLGYAQISRPLSLISLITLAGVWRETIQSVFNISIWLFMALCIVAVVCVVLVLGFWYYLTGAYKKAIDVNNQNNVQFQKQRSDISRLQEDVGSIRESIEHIEKELGRW